MDAAEAREERLKAKAARDAAKAKYDAAPLASAEHKELEKDWLRAEVAFAQAHLEWVKAQVPRNDGDVADAKDALARADRELNKVTGAAVSGLFSAPSFARALICFVPKAASGLQSTPSPWPSFCSRR